MVFRDQEQKSQFPVLGFSVEKEVIHLEFLRSIRSADFQLCMGAMDKMMRWFFALDHIHYAPWLSVHVFDMKMFPTTNSDIYQAFQDFGCFVVRKTIILSLAWV